MVHALDCAAIVIGGDILFAVTKMFPSDFSSCVTHHTYVLFVPAKASSPVTSVISHNESFGGSHYYSAFCRELFYRYKH